METDLGKDKRKKGGRMNFVAVGKRFTWNENEDDDDGKNVF